MTLKEQLEAELKEAQRAAKAADRPCYDDMGGFYENGYADGLERAMELLNIMKTE